MLPNPTSGFELEVVSQTRRETHGYQKVNAYTHTASIQQILAIVIFIIHLVLHCVFMIRPILYINNPLLYFLWAILLITLSLTIVDYFIVTCGDPVDRLIQYPTEVQKWKLKEMEFDHKNAQGDLSNQSNPKSSNTEVKNPFEVKECKPCKRAVKLRSYHCWTCKRCVEDMDHHCKYLNNCIGSRNYDPFFRLLIIVCVYFSCGIAIGVWVFVAGHSDPQVDSLSYSKWLGLVYALVSVTCLIFVSLLLGFHCYISCYLHMTTIEYIFRDTPSNNNISEERMDSQGTGQQQN